MEDVSFGEWAAMSALNGIVGALLGGVLAGGFAWALLRKTIEHERQERRRADRAAIVGRVLHALLDLYEAIQEFDIRPRADRDVARAMEQNLRAKLLFVEVISGPVDQRLTRRMRDIRKNLADLPRVGPYRVPSAAQAASFKRDTELTVLTEIAVMNEFDPDMLGDPDRVELE